MGKQLLFSIVLSLITFAGYGQRPLTNSRQSSYYTYIYKITNADISDFYQKPNYKPADQILRNPVDSFKSDKYWENTLPPGNYLKVYALKNQLKYELIENHSAFFKNLTDGDEQRFILTDKIGHPITNAIVKVNGRTVEYNQKRTYVINRLKKINIIQADYLGVSNFFLLKQEGYDEDDDKSWFNRLWVAVKKIFSKKENGSYRDDSDYKGFMVFNKPKYKPRDTVKFKAYILNNKTKAPALQKQLLVMLAAGYNRDEKHIGTVNSYRDGGYEYSFVLSDSLKLQLDQACNVLLVDPYVEKDKEGTSDYRYDKQGRKILMSGAFEYEDYELKSINFKARIDKATHYPGEKVSVYLKATDENDLPVPDGRVNLTLVTNYVNYYKASHVFVPDTLWTHKVTLDPIGETKVEITDSIFPKADVNYRIVAEFLNSSNEREEQRVSATYKHERYKITTELSRDTLKATCLEFGKEIRVPAIIAALDANDDTLSKTKVMLPSKTVINPYATTYNIETDSTDTDFELTKEDAGISLSAVRTSDSLFIKADNPRNLHFWYSVYADGKVIENGQEDQLFYKKAYPNSKTVGVRIDYIWGGELKTGATAAFYRKDLLNINVNQPVSIYPGQQAQTSIVVTNADGKAVPGVDVTAWALTRKFSNYRAPSLPYFDRSYPYRYPKRYEGDSPAESSGSLKLNWSRFSHEMGLDSIAYYQFTHTKTIYQREEPGTDTLTQIAPFVVKNGDIIPVHILYIDEKPVYFSQAQQLQRYSFIVRPGLHSIRLRTSHQNIRMDSVCVEPSKKLIIGLNADYLPSVKQSDTLSQYEADLINKYMITMDNNFGNKMAVIRQNENVFLLNPDGAGKSKILTGPLKDNYTTFDLQGESPRFFLTEPGYSYLFEPGLLKQTSIPTKYPFNPVLSSSPGIDDHTQYAITQARADSIWQRYLDLRNSSEELFENKPANTSQTGQLVFKREVAKNENPVLIKNIIIYKNGDPDFALIYPGKTTTFNNLGGGTYRLLFLLQGDSYDIRENINIKPHGINYYGMRVLPTHPKDSVSLKINGVINNRNGRHDYTDYDIRNDALKIKEAFNEKYFNTSGFTLQVSGVVTSSADKEPLPGVSVIIKGTNVGTVTDTEGKFTLKVPSAGKLIVSYVGFNTRELEIIPGTSLNINLITNSKELREVVVIGYGTQMKRSVTGAVTTVNSMLMGQAAGIMVVPAGPGGGTSIRLRGTSSVAGKEPLYVVDGVIVNNLDGIDVATVASVSVLQDVAATALYGARAANGVIIVNTNKQQANNAGAPQQSTDQSIRKSFSDYAYWQPKLTTDENGKAIFTTVFPDDITNWRTFVIGINGSRQSGFAEYQIKSFKPLSASFLAPLFAVEGDELNTLGKITNYNTDAAKLTRTFTYNGKQIKQDNLEVNNSKIDTLNLTAANTDSLTFEYTIKRDNGYFDGERRKIPVIKQGVQETMGVFEALNGDTTVTLKFDPAKGPVTFHAEASMLPALMEETQKLRNYKYLCNEQLASKIKGLLMEKRIKKFLGEDFKYEKNINEVIKKLQENRKTQGTWGWWKDSDEELWISLHVVEALVDAQKDGYQIQLDRQKLTDYLVYQMESYKGQDKLVCLELLHKLEAKVDYPKYFGVIEKENAAIAKKLSGYTPSNYDKLRLILLKQQAEVVVKLDSLLAGQHRTMFGNIYWGDDSYRFFDNSIQLSVLAYKIIKNEGKHNSLLPKIQGYFLEQRKEGEWRNTYESALILETILPDVLTSDKQTKPSALTIKGATTETVTKFPYTATITDSKLAVSKTGTLPVYITDYQQFWNIKPEKVSKDFTVDTWFEKKETRLTKLKGGETVQLKAEVTAKGDADFVMIEIPIPAGCSYESKEQSWQNNEVHREYFKEKVSIFCRKLKQGKYEFTINLIPRYDGKYTLNPAKAEMMYFPVFYGREGMKKVVIGE